jgi:hypothetical protein
MKFFLIVLVLFFVGMRVLLPVLMWLFRHTGRRMGEHFMRQHHQSFGPPPDDGRTPATNRTPDKKVDKNVGDYVEYEEIKDR